LTGPSEFTRTDIHTQKIFPNTEEVPYTRTVYSLNPSNGLPHPGRSLKSKQELPALATTDKEKFFES
jgi:hypothetical protein